MIPKVIHYCWFGNAELPKRERRCLESWKKYCPDYRIREWNEKNFDIESAPLFIRQAYECKKFAYVSDYARIKIIYDHGGIYLDTDVEVVKRFDELLDHQAFFGLDEDKNINTGNGFGAVKHFPLLQDICKQYEGIRFLLEDGSYNMITCPFLNTDAFYPYGFKRENSYQVLEKDVVVLPTEYLCPKSLLTDRIKRTKNTISIHHFSTSWFSPESRKQHNRMVRENRRIERFPTGYSKACLVRKNITA